MDKDASSGDRSPDVGSKLSKNTTVSMLLWGLAALALGQSLQYSNGFLTPPALGWLTFALMFAGTSVLAPRWSSRPVPQKIFWAVLAAGLVWQVLQLLMAPPAMQISDAYLQQLWQFRASIVVGGVCALLSLAPRGWYPAWLRAGLIAAAFFAILAAGVWIIHASPDPFIDVYIYQQSSSQALLEGHDPYELTPPDIYGDPRYYGPQLVRNGKMTIGNPYPPLSIYLSFPGYAVGGDIRYSDLAAILLTGLLMIFLLPGREALLAAYIFLFTPRLFYVLEQSWTEPLVLLLAVAVIWCAIQRPAWKFIALGLLLASKQYLIFLFPLAALLIPARFPRRSWMAALGQSVGIAAVVTAPLAILNLPAFLWNVGLAQFYQPFRMDALSYAVVYARVTGIVPTQLLPFIVLGACMWLTWRTLGRSPAGFAAALTFCLALFFAFNKQAFCNYYFLVLGLMCCTLAAISRPDSLFITNPERA